MEIKPENLLSVRVGRVVPKRTDVLSFISQEEFDQFFSSTTIDLLHLSDQYQQEWIIVPNTYSKVYLGEMFSFVINLTNDSVLEPMLNVHVRIDMQINNRAIFLKELNFDRLDAKTIVDNIISYEIKEVHCHTLICTLSFNLGSDEERHTCRKYFPYQISKPIDVKSKFYYTECDEIYLEAMFQNLTLLPIQLRTIVFDSANFDVASLNFNLDVKDQWIFGATNRLNPNESRQYLFVLTPKKEIRSNASLLKSINVIGKLDIIWYSGIGEKGHIQTSQLEKSISSDNLKIYIDEIPTETQTKNIFKIKLRIVNYSLKTIEPLISFINDEKQKIFWLGQCDRNLGEMKQFQSLELLLNLYPIKLGLHSIPSIKILDQLTNECFEFRELASINVI
ncbi:Ribonuclease Z [Sarcoptes scabiei]|nr:Ribonuclease Z [Sarcoptes scabiei]